MPKRYIHISYYARINGGNSEFYGDSLIWVDNQSLDDIREALKEVSEKKYNIKLNQLPTILSLSEISEELYNILCKKQV